MLTILVFDPTANQRISCYLNAAKTYSSELAAQGDSNWMTSEICRSRLEKNWTRLSRESIGSFLSTIWRPPTLEFFSATPRVSRPARCPPPSSPTNSVPTTS